MVNLSKLHGLKLPNIEFVLMSTIILEVTCYRPRPRWIVQNRKRKYYF